MAKNATFTQEDLDQGRLAYLENGSIVASDQFGLFVSDPNNPNVTRMTIQANVEMTGTHGGLVASGASGAETLFAGLGSNYFFGDGGTTVSYANSPNGVSVDLSKGIASNGYGGTDTLSNIHSIIGSLYNDTLIGGSGNDTFSGSGGNNVMDGGGGTNTLDYSELPAGVTANLRSGTVQNGYGGTDTLSNIHSIIGSLYNDTLIGGSGNDTFSGSGGNNAMDGGGGANTLDYSGSPAGVTVNLRNGTVQNGYGGTDTISNFQVVIGSALNDVFVTGFNIAIDGRLGSNTVVFSGKYSDYQITYDGYTKSNAVTDLRQNSPNGTDTITNVQSFQFTDSTTNLDVAGRLASAIINNPDGTHIGYVWDTQSQNSWSNYATTYDANFRALTQTTNYDDGTKTLKHGTF